MMTLNTTICISVFLFLTTGTKAQVIDHPNSSMKSPETLVINRIEAVYGQTILHCTIENRISNGYFCIDKNTYIIYADGSKVKLTKAEGIPSCPDTRKFREAGEKADFKLVFPELKANTLWIDVVEECSSGCLYFYGITLDKELNRKLDEVFASSEKATPEESIILFKTLLDSVDGSNLGIEGLLYTNIINASLEAGDKVGASVWYKRFLTSGAPRLSYYLKFLNDKGIKFQ